MFDEINEMLRFVQNSDIISISHEGKYLEKEILTS